MRRAAYWLFPLIALAVAVFIVVLLIKINPSAPVLKIAPEEGDTDSLVKGKSASGSWLDRFSITEDKGYFYPVNEVSLKLDMGDEHIASSMYRLVAVLNGSNDILHVKEELSNSELPYRLYKAEGDMMTLTVDSTDQTQLASLVTKLKTYQITANVSPFTEEK